VAIRRLRVENFKSFKQLDLELGDFNVVIGANASGKSNLVQIFRFLRDIGQHGLENAVSLQGGIEYLRTLAEPSASREREDDSRIVCDLTLEYPVRSALDYGPGSACTAVASRQARHRFELGVIEGAVSYDVLQETLEVELEIFRSGPKADDSLPPIRGEPCGRSRIVLRRSGEQIKLEWPDYLPFFRDNKRLLDRRLTSGPKPVSSSLVLPQLLPRNHFGRTLYTTAGTIAVYDFDPKLPRRAVPVAGKTTLEEDGGNLAIALRDTLKDSSKRRKLNNLLRDILGFVEDLDVQQLPDKSLFFRVAERFAPGLYFPAPLVSDGTVKVIALLVALHFDSRETTVIEEPERSIHPYLIRRLVEEMREVSRRKQILITTHNPELVRHARLEELLLISRDKRGLSQVSRPAEKESVRFFLKQEMGIEEMYVQNLLELPS